MRILLLSALNFEPISVFFVCVCMTKKVVKVLLLVTVYLFDYSHPSGSEVISYCGFELQQLMTNDVEHLFMCVFDICLSFLEK